MSHTLCHEHQLKMLYGRTTFWKPILQGVYTFSCHLNKCSVVCTELKKNEVAIIDMFPLNHAAIEEDIHLPYVLYNTCRMVQGLWVYMEG